MKKSSIADQPSNSIRFHNLQLGKSLQLYRHGFLKESGSDELPELPSKGSKTAYKKPKENSIQAVSHISTAAQAWSIGYLYIWDLWILCFSSIILIILKMSTLQVLWSRAPSFNLVKTKVCWLSPIFLILLRFWYRCWIALILRAACFEQGCKTTVMLAQSPVSMRIVNVGTLKFICNHATTILWRWLYYIDAMCSVNNVIARYSFICIRDADYYVQSKRREQTLSSLDIGFSADMKMIVHQTSSIWSHFSHF